MPLELLNQTVIGLFQIPVFLRGGYILPVRDRLRRSATVVPDDPYTLIVALDKEVNKYHLLAFASW
jgi:alpha-glucosidase (family GH31 glycosyl hydrolase)